MRLATGGMYDGRWALLLSLIVYISEVTRWTMPADTPMDDESYYLVWKSHQTNRASAAKTLLYYPLIVLIYTPFRLIAYIIYKVIRYSLITLLLPLQSSFPPLLTPLYFFPIPVVLIRWLSLCVVTSLYTHLLLISFFFISVDTMVRW